MSPEHPSRAERRRQLLADMAARALTREGGVPALEAIITRSRSLKGRDTLAYIVSNERLSADELVSQLLENPEGLRIDHVGAALAFARLLTKSAITGHDRMAALALFQHIEETFGSEVFTQRDADLYTQTLLAEGRPHKAVETAHRLQATEHVRLAIEADILPVGEPGWLRTFNTLAGLDGDPAPISLTGTGPTPFDRLHAPVTESVSGPLVTVAVTAYRPGPSFFTSLASVVHQTWQNLEIIVVDDASGPDYEEIFQWARELDPRVRVVHLEHNGGTYRARNAALLLASGEFFTVHDDDDWAHPRRIEESVRPLLEDGSLIATKGGCVSADDELRITQVGRPSILQCGTSLTFRRAPVIASVGYYDSVRKGADTEIEKRLSTRFPGRLLVDPDVRLTVRRVGTTRLSGDEFGAGWRHDARVLYASAYGRWHRSTENAAMVVPVGERRFARPHRFAISSPARLRYDVVFYGDWRSLGGPQHSMLAEIEALLSAGARVAVCNVEPYRFLRTSYGRFNDPINDLLNSGRVDYLCIDDPAEIELTIVRYPPVLQFPPASPIAWQTKYLWIVANQAPTESDGSDRRYVVEDCTNHARAMFGVEPLWVPQGPRVRAMLMKEAPGTALAEFDNPAIIDLSSWWSEHLPDPVPPVRIGRYSRDHVMKFPGSAEALRHIYRADDPSFQVRIMGGVNVVGQLLEGQELPTNWEVLPYGAEDTRAFLRSIDFFVYYDHPVSMEAFGRSILEAIASGVVVVLDPKYEPVFGPAAVYASPEDAPEVIRRYAADPGAFRDQVAKATSFVQQEFSRESFLERIRPFVGLGDAGHQVSFHVSPQIRAIPSSPEQRHPLTDHLIFAEDGATTWTVTDPHPFGPAVRAAVVGELRVNPGRLSDIALSMVRGRPVEIPEPAQGGAWALISESDRYVGVLTGGSKEVYWCAAEWGLYCSTDRSWIANQRPGRIARLQPGRWLLYDKLTATASMIRPGSRGPSARRALVTRPERATDRS